MAIDQHITQFHDVLKFTLYISPNLFSGKHNSRGKNNLVISIEFNIVVRLNIENKLLHFKLLKRDKVSETRLKINLNTKLLINKLLICQKKTEISYV